MNPLFLISIYLIFLFLNIPSNGFANKGTSAIILAPEANIASFKSFANSSNNYQAYSLIQENFIRQNADAAQIGRNFETAKRLIFSNNPTAAKDKFLSIVKQSQDQDWSDMQREIMWTSFYYLAELSKSPVEAEYWIKKMIYFAPEKTPDLNKYSPNLRKLFVKTFAELSKAFIKWRPWPNFRDFEYLFINGRRIAITSSTEVSMGDSSYRLTFISNTYKALTLHSHSQTLSQLTIKKVPLVIGSCAAPQITEISRDQNIRVYFSDSCIRDFAQNQWKQNIKLSDLEKLSAKPKEESLNLSAIPSQKKVKQNFGKKQWIWTALGTIALGSAIALYNSSPNRKTKKTVIEE